jgi:hypothetical protein
MRVKAIWIFCAFALSVLALAATGCGGDGGSTTTVTVTETETVEASGTDDSMTETDESMTETDDESMTGTDETDTDAMEETETDAMGTDTTESPDLSFITSENCREFVQFASALGQALSGTGDTDVEEAAAAMQEFADQAPEEIRDDFQVLADAYAKIANALEGVDLTDTTPDADAIAKLAQLSQEIDQAELTEASQNISEWTSENCTNG